MPASRLIAQADGDIEQAIANLLVRHVQMLVGDEAEELVLDDRAADVPPSV